MKYEGIHPTAEIGAGAKVDPSVTIGAFSLIHDNATIGKNTRIGSHCEIGVPVETEPGGIYIGADSTIRSHSVFYSGSSFGPGMTTGHRVTVREGVQAQEGLQIGTLSDFQGRLEIGRHVRTHSNVHLGQGASIGDFVWIFPYVVLTNDPHPPSEGHLIGVTVEDFAAIATMTTVLPGITVGRDSLVGAHSLVSRDVPAGHVVAGVPAKDRGDASTIMLSDGSGPAYPWRRHFHRGYPPEDIELWRNEFS